MTNMRSIFWNSFLVLYKTSGENKQRKMKTVFPLFSLNRLPLFLLTWIFLNNSAIEANKVKVLELHSGWTVMNQNGCKLMMNVSINCQHSFRIFFIFFELFAQPFVSRPWQCQMEFSPLSKIILEMFYMTWIIRIWVG